MCVVQYGEDVFQAFMTKSNDRPDSVDSTHLIGICYKNKKGVVSVTRPCKKLAVSYLTDFLDDFVLKNSDVKIDYVHGLSAIDQFTGNLFSENAFAFILPVMAKSDLFPAVMQGGILPRKTFSMGKAVEKRFYFEGKRIR